jgi:hypothetical protein
MREIIATLRVYSQKIGIRILLVGRNAKTIRNEARNGE